MKAVNRGMIEEVKELVQRGEEAEKLIDRLLDWAIANRKQQVDWNGKECRFVKCYTYHGTFPSVLIDALRFMHEPVKGLKRAKE